MIVYPMVPGYGTSTPYTDEKARCRFLEVSERIATEDDARLKAKLQQYVVVVPKNMSWWQRLVLWFYNRYVHAR